MEFLQNLKIELPYYPAIPHLAVYPEKNENTNSKSYMHPAFIAALFLIAKTFKQSMSPIED